MASNNGNGGSGGTSRDPEIDRARLRAVHAALTAGDVPTAGKLAEDALGDGIDHPMVLNLVAGRREEDGRLEEALVLLRRALEKAPDAIGVMNAIGLCLYRMGRYEEAATAYGEAVAKEPRFAPALANRAGALLALDRREAARGDYEAAAAIDPGNLVAANGLAALALWRGDAAAARRLAEAVLAREPGYPGATLTLAGADLAEGRPGEAEHLLGLVLGDARIGALDRAAAWTLRGDALDALGRFDEAFAAWRDAKALERAHYAPAYEGRPGTVALLRELTASLADRRIPAAWGHGGRSPAQSHVFLAGFPCAGTTALEQVLDAHPDVVTLADRECLADSAREWMSDAAGFARFCALEDEALEPWREAYWRRVGEAGADPAGKIFIDRQPFNSFKLPLIARLFPGARILIARRDPRDHVLACLRHAFPMSAPAWQMLTLEGIADLYAATMAMADAVETAFGLFTQPVALEAMLADLEGEAKALCAFIGLPWDGTMRAAAAATASRGAFAPADPQRDRGLAALGVGKWRDHETGLAPAMPALAPWLARFAAA